MHAGQLISGKYRLQRVLGAGSMGSVWAARNELTNRDFAVKFLLPELSKNDQVLNRFFLEARACGQIKHPAIVDVYDMGRAEDDSPYLVMELLEGEGFDHRLARQGTLRPVDACRYLALIARGLEEAHERGLIHRDLKPGNIFFADDGGGDLYPKVLDFGVSKETDTEEAFDKIQTHTGQVLGSPAYMSPEQAKGELDVDPRADIWALGVILYESLTGRLPFDANNYNALMLCIISQPHKPAIELAPELPPKLSRLIDQLLTKEREKRIASATELANKLEQIYLGMTQSPLSWPGHQSVAPLVGSATQSSWFKARTQGRKSRWPKAPIAIAAISALTVGALAIVMNNRPSNGFQPAQAAAGGIRAVVLHAQGELAQAKAQEHLAEAEATAKEARRRSEAADKARAAASKLRPQRRRPKRTVRRKVGVHGGVAGPGF